MTRTNPDSKAQGDLKAAFDEMLASLAAARDAIDDPALKPPPPTDRNLAEGYRYLLRFLASGMNAAKTRTIVGDYNRDGRDDVLLAKRNAILAQTAYVSAAEVESGYREQAERAEIEALV